MIQNLWALIEVPMLVVLASNYGFACVGAWKRLDVTVYDSVSNSTPWFLVPRKPIIIIPFLAMVVASTSTSPLENR